MEGKEPPGIRTIRPLRDGVIADFNAAEQMIRGMVKMVKSQNGVGSLLLLEWWCVFHQALQKLRFVRLEIHLSMLVVEMYI